MNLPAAVYLFMAFSALGILGNVANIEMFFGVNQIFGSIFALLAAYRFGPWWGGLAAMIIHSYTIYLWGHPYAFISFVLEALIVGFLLRWRIKNIFLADLIYWLCLGVWLVPLFYGHIMGLPETQVSLIMLKQPANGLLNALLASLLFISYIYWQKVETHWVSLQTVLFILLMTMVSFSLYLVANLTSRYIFERFQNIATTSLENYGQYIEKELHTYLKTHLEQLEQFASKIENNSATINQPLFKLSIDNNLDNIWLYQTDKAQLLFSQHHFFVETPKPLSCTETAIFWKQANTLYFSKKINDQCYIASSQLVHLQKFLAHHSISAEHSIYITDKQEVVTSSFIDASSPPSGTATPVRAEIAHLLPNKKLPKMKLWKSSYYCYQFSPQTNLNWQITVYSSLSNSIDKLQQIYIFTFQMMLALILLFSPISYYVARRLTYTMKKLGQVTEDLPQKLQAHQEIKWPQSHIVEIMTLSQNFSTVTTKLESIFRDSEARFQSLFLNTQDAILVLDYPELQISNYNPNALKLLGNKLKQNPQPDVKDFFENLPDKIFQYQYQLNDQTFWLKQKAHASVPVRIDKQYLSYQGKTVILLNLQDISAEQQYQEQLRLISVVFETTAEGIMITDPYKKILMVNRGFSAITGYSSEEVVGETPHKLHSGWQNKSFYTNMWVKIKQQGQWQGEVWNRRKNGEIYAEWLSLYEVRDAQQQISNYIGVFNDITEKKQAQDKINQLAYYDTLTGLPNRQLFQDRFQHALEVSVRQDNIVALMFIDLDNFKSINDTLGHQAGDLLLKTVGKRMQNQIRSSDTLARIGGDEFTIILENIQNKNEVSHIAISMMDAVSQPVFDQETEMHTSCSIGICFYPDDASSVSEMMQYADTAMYRAKEEGKNSFQFYTTSMNTEVQKQMEIERHLRQALTKQHLSLLYQPQVAIDSGTIVGVEALLRWHDPVLGQVSPDIFIPIAERSGLMGDIEQWVLRTGAKQQVAWRKQGIKIEMSLNISNHQFRKSDFVEQTLAIFQQEGADCHLFDLELTERIVMDTEESQDKIAALKQAGFRLSLDDFGTGQSSLSYLKRFNIDKLKIDKSFVDDLPGDEQSCDIARAITSLAQAMNMETVAEGVETAKQLHFLQQLGCVNYQGYFFSKALSAEDLQKRWLG